MDVTPANAVGHKHQALREQAEIKNLAKRDRAVRAHEQAHASVGGRYAGSPNYSFARGPNGVNYAVAGHVDVDVSRVPGDPAATLAKMMVVRRAAMAPQNPSPQDRAVAAAAMQQAAQARAELAADGSQTWSEGTEQGSIEGSEKSAGSGPRDGTKGAFVDLLV